ncbi:MAG: hypothetical protein FRX48_01242 [Lasallia pustulata]|uniref:Uncharacterized protein n=1 Tax=Lasallia pustulata TaxID=136370 RepID=A0A5M8PXR7_9LECA|nr:MAG: hypothetical protein FRX48_01242 [Lasallia pustulata]
MDWSFSYSTLTPIEAQWPSRQPHQVGGTVQTVGAPGGPQIYIKAALTALTSHFPSTNPSHTEPKPISAKHPHKPTPPAQSNHHGANPPTRPLHPLLQPVNSSPRPPPRPQHAKPPPRPPHPPTNPATTHLDPLPPIFPAPIGSTSNPTLMRNACVPYRCLSGRSLLSGGNGVVVSTANNVEVFSTYDRLFTILGLDPNDPYFAAKKAGFEALGVVLVVLVLLVAYVVVVCRVPLGKKTRGCAWRNVEGEVEEGTVMREEKK